MPSSIDDTRLIISDAQELEGSLIGFKCEDCNVVVFGPAKFCQSCTSDNLIPITFGSLGSLYSCLLYTSPSPRDRTRSRMPSSA